MSIGVVDSNGKVHPILSDSSGRPYVRLSDNSGNNTPAGDITNRPIFVTAGYNNMFHVHLHKDTIGADTALMLIDLSDTTNWPHAATGKIVIYNVHVSIAASKITDAHVELGFLSDVGLLNGDFNIIYAWEVGHAGTNEPRDIDHSLNYSLVPFVCDVTKWFGPKRANDPVFQTDVNLEGPDAATSYPSGDGDLAVFVDWTAGSLNLSISVDYYTIA